MQAQFARIEPFSYMQLPRILGEASREPSYCRHVPEAKRPSWLIGSEEAIATAAAKFMCTPAHVRQAGGSKLLERKRRRDFRCLVAGVVSWPLSFEEIKAARDPQLEGLRLRQWFQLTLDWVKTSFRDQPVAAVAHLDEDHPHLHFFAVGDANLLHPGLRAEFDAEGQRLAGRKEKVVRYKAAMREWLDGYHRDVGSALGLARTLDRPPLPRIKDRALALRVLALERRLLHLQDTVGLSEVEAVARATTPRDRQRLVF